MSDSMTEDVSREDLKSKPLSQWSEAEREAAADMSHTLGVSLLNTRRLGQWGDKGQSWDEILGTALDRLETLQGMQNGIYLVGDTPKTLHPLALEDGSGDGQLLEEALEEAGYHD